MMTTAAATLPAAPTPEVTWYRAFSRTCEIARKWIRNTRGVLEYLLTEMRRGERELKVPNWKIAEWLGCSVRWVAAGLQQLEEWGIIRRYWLPGRARECGRVIVLLVFPKGWFDTEEDRKTRKASARKHDGPVNTSYTPVAPPTAAEPERARPATAEEVARAQVEDAERDARARALWESLSAGQRAAIEAQVGDETGGFVRMRWPKVFEARCMGLALEQHEAGRPIDPRAP